MAGAAELAKGKWKSILESVGGIDPKYLDGRHHKCPVSGEGDNRFRFSNKNGDGNYFCACSDGRKDGFDLLKCCKNYDFAEAAKEIERFLGTSSVRDDPVREKKSPAQIDRDLARICAGINTRERDAVLRYLRGRGIRTVVPSTVDVFQTTTNYGLHHSGLSVPMTAMLSLLRMPNGAPETVHITYLKDGMKAPIARPRILATPKRGVAGCAVRLRPVEDGLLGVGEGVETSLSCNELYRVPTWATLSANGMASFELPTDVDVRRLIIFVDDDANFVGQTAGFLLARRIAQKHKNVDVEIRTVNGPILPGNNTDFNDVLVECRNGP